MQNKNRKGFTLIELLAVIVILAIIALIAVPVIMNVITKARKSAFEDSAYGIVKAGELYYSNQLLEPEGMTESKEFTIENGTFTSTEKLDVSGSLPSSGKVTVTSEGKVAIAISNGEYCIRKATTESSVKAEKLSDLGGVCNYKTVFTKASDGTEVPTCIANNTICSTDDITNGLKVGVQVNDTKTYDFYVIGEDTDKGTIALIMSEDLGVSPWILKEDYLEAGGEDLSNDGGACQIGGICNEGSKGPLTALKTLEDRTSNWTNIPLGTYQVEDENNYYASMTRTARARLITHNEATGLGCEDYNSGTCPDWLYKNSNSHWTSSAYAGISAAWIVDYSGLTAYQDYIGNYGIRPVITVSKTIL